MTEQTREKSRKALDDIPLDHLIEYVLEYFNDEMWEALAESRHP